MVLGPEIGLKVPFLTLRSLRDRPGWCAPQVLKSCYKSLHFPKTKMAVYPLSLANDAMLRQTFGMMYCGSMLICVGEILRYNLSY